jgi:phage terminase small subunit
MSATHRGRKSARELEAAGAVVLVQPQRLKPPRSLPVAARRTWRDTVNAFEAGFFRTSDAPLLRVFCVASATADEAATLLAAEGIVQRVGDRVLPHPAVGIFASASAVLCSVSTKLKIAASTRLRNDTASMRAAASPTSRRPWS